MTCNDPGAGSGGGGGGSPAPVKLTFFDVNPQLHSVTIQLSNGFAMSIDDQQSQVRISNSFSTAELPLQSVLLQWADGDSAQASMMRAKIHDMVARPEDRSMIGLESYFNSQAQVSPNVIQPFMYAGPPGEGEFSCNTDYFWLWGFECKIKALEDGFGGGAMDALGGYLFGYYDTQPYDGPTDTDNYRYWEQRREDNCDDILYDGLFLVASVGALSGTCAATGMTAGAFAAACGGSAVAMIASGGNLVSHSRVCSSNYPGPDNWP